jgi:hypothetical protein
MVRFLAVPALLAAALAFACGGDDGSNGEPSGGGSGSAPTQPAGGGNGTNGGGGSSAGANTALVVVGGERYEFTLKNCVALGGALNAAGKATGGADISVNIDLPPANWESSRDDWEPPSVRLSDDVKNVDWRAGGEVIDEFAAVGEGQSQVDSYVVDGNRASGTATFVDMYAVMKGDFKAVKGTFEITCK